MGFKEAYVPENEEEMELMEDVHMATRRAHRRGLSKPAIARILAFMGAASLQPGEGPDSPDEPEGESLRSAMEGGAEDPEPANCPECGQPIENVKSELGGELWVEPCGCTFAWDEREQLGHWAARLDPEEDDA